MNQPKRGPGRPRKNAEARPTRTPLGVPRAKLSVEQKDPNYAYRWINDKEDRIARALEAGYEFVKRGDTSAPGDKDVTPQNTDLGTNVSKVVGTKEGGGPLTAYLMRLKKKFYDEDQQAKQKYVDATETGIKRGRGLKDQIGEHGYVKSFGITADK